MECRRPQFRARYPDRIVNRHDTPRRIIPTETAQGPGTQRLTELAGAIGILEQFRDPIGQ